VECNQSSFTPTTKNTYPSAKLHTQVSRFSAKKLAFFLKTDVTIIFSAKKLQFVSKLPIFSPLYLAKIFLKITTLTAGVT
jgi:hypothetical protein